MWDIPCWDSPLCLACVWLAGLPHSAICSQLFIGPSETLFAEKICRVVFGRCPFLTCFLALLCTQVVLCGLQWPQIMGVWHDNLHKDIEHPLWAQPLIGLSEPKHDFWPRAWGSAPYNNAYHSTGCWKCQIGTHVYGSLVRRGRTMNTGYLHKGIIREHMLAIFTKRSTMSMNHP